MIRILCEAETSKFFTSDKVGDLQSEVSAFVEQSTKETPEVRQLADSMNTVVSGFMGTFNEETKEDLAKGIHILRVSLTKLNNDCTSYGIGNDADGTVLIPAFVAKEWVSCFDECRSDCWKLFEILKNLYVGGSDLVKIVNNETTEFENPVKIDIPQSLVCNTIVTDTSNKTCRRWGAKGRYETYMQFISSILPFDTDGKALFSRVGSGTLKENYDVITAKGYQLEIKNATSAKGRGIFKLKFDGEGPLYKASCSYFSNNEQVVVFNGTDAYVLRSMRDLVTYLKPKCKWDAQISGKPEIDFTLRRYPFSDKEIAQHFADVSDQAIDLPVGKCGNKQPSLW